MSRLLDKSFEWIPSETHDADSTMFRVRQLKRIAEANAERERRKKEQENVTQLKRKGNKWDLYT